MEKILEQILGELKEIREGQEGLGKGVDSIGAKLDGLDTKIGGIDQKVENLKESIIEGLEPYFDRLEKHIDNSHEKVIPLTDKQQNTIDVLSARSIKHEAEIKELKRLVKNK
ncbi:hypothetical protein EV207_11524 [Scopulibacillus darangshiensis]|uniref:Uncharacterized protein n=1 Tax=Scopulibacillus darangshiensis TaxID=442528 RepID=A0A4R2P3T8_9BACL|nr:hypothetical protein [Scopulibacillus darangshiensis]TCP28798.1 hypothetical protein EV207_11524 [Scopulibacillus darangshiensis]